ncbi:MAG: hypothetical protein H6627_08985 [Calditrichae bacterium]|nr:hypothetical protein [Calditrichota bacterium]MCB9058688.1 hypothetical protein [Calditrichia bacterium]
MEYTIYDFMGNIGVVLIIGTYLFLQLDRIKSNALSYSILNAIGAFCIIVSLIFRFNLSAFIVELFWLLISLVGVVRFILFTRNK